MQESLGGLRRRIVKRVIVLLAVVSVVQLACVFSGGDTLELPSGSSGEKVPLYPGGKLVSIDEADKLNFVVDVLGYDYLLFSSSTNISWTEDTGDEVQLQLDDLLPESKWRLQNDWVGWSEFLVSMWKKGDLEIAIVVFDNLDSDALNDLQRRYGLSGPVPGSTLILAHIIDRTQPLPNATATARAVSSEATSTAHAESYSATATVSARNAAVSATESAQATNEALVVLRQQLEVLSDNFDSVELADTWTVYRPDPNRWDLESRPGMLHVVGSPERESGMLNVFAQKVTFSDVDIVTKIETDNMLKDGQSAWIAVTPADYSDDGLTVEIGLAFDRYDGYRIYMWECDREDCGWWVDTVGREHIDFEGHVYLKLCRRGKDYEGYYSFDGETWSFVGQAKEFPIITDQVTIAAGGGREEFDAYFDYVRYEVPGLVP